MKCPQIKLKKSGEEVTAVWDSKNKCKQCGKEILIARKGSELLKIELVGLAEWDRHECK